MYPALCTPHAQSLTPFFYRCSYSPVPIMPCPRLPSINVYSECLTPRSHLCSYGPVQSVKQLSGDESGGQCCTVAFVDICSAAKAHKADHRIDDTILKTTYYEPSVTSLTASGHYVSSSATSAATSATNGSSQQQQGVGGSTGGSVSHYPPGPPSSQTVQAPLGARSPRFG